MVHVPDALPLRITAAAADLPGAPPLHELAAGLAAAGHEPFLFERDDAPSMLFIASALQVTVHGEDAVAAAFTPLGGRLLRHLAQASAAHVTAEGKSEVRFRFPRCRAHDAEERLRAPSFLDLLRALTLAIPRDDGAPFPPLVAGMLGFDHVDCFEALPANPADPTAFPDALFRVSEALIVAEPGGRTRVVSYGASAEEAEAALGGRVAGLRALPPPGPVPPAPPVSAVVDIDDAAFAQLVRRMKVHIAAGDVFQVVPSRSFAAPCADPMAAYRRLRAANPSPGMFYADCTRWTLFGASPEPAVQIARDGEGLRFSVRPMAGTRRRGRSAEEDAALEAELLGDDKEMAEHMMLVDLARNDVARVCVPGTRRVDRLAFVERFQHVMHITSEVSGRLRPDMDPLHALVACMNVGTLVGAPKLKATELLRRYEVNRRGPYGGAIGWFAADGRMDSFVIIRSAVVEGGTATVRAGAGVVADSDPAAEADETRRKAASVLAALGAEVPA